jgi:hypothetical protein
MLRRSIPIVLRQRVRSIAACAAIIWSAAVPLPAEAAKSSLETAVATLCGLGVTHFLIPEAHQRPDNVMVNMAVVQGVLNTGANFTYCRESHTSMTPEKAATSGRLELVAFVVATLLPPDAERVPEHLSDLGHAERKLFNTLGMGGRARMQLLHFGTKTRHDLTNAIANSALTVISAGGDHILASTNEKGSLFFSPWGPPLPNPFPSPLLQQDYGAMSRLMPQRSVLIVEPSSLLDYRASGFSRGIMLWDAQAEWNHHNRNGYAVYRRMDNTLLNATVIFPAEHMLKLQKKLKPSKKNVYLCNEACMEWVERDHDEL